MSFIIRGILIGILASIPIGPVAMLVLQKSFNDGWKAGFSCGLGCVIADFVYSMVSVYALTWVSDFIAQHMLWFECVGGSLVIIIGAMMILRNDVSSEQKGTIVIKSKMQPSNTAKALGMCLSNPGALAVMIAIFAFFQMDTSGHSPIIPLLVVISVCAGTTLYWYAFSKIAAKFGKDFKMETLVKVNRIFGVVIVVFGAYFIFRGIGLMPIE